MHIQHAAEQRVTEVGLGCRLRFPAQCSELCCRVSEDRFPQLLAQGQRVQRCGFMCAEEIPDVVVQLQERTPPVSDIAGQQDDAQATLGGPWARRDALEELRQAGPARGVIDDGQGGDRRGEQDLDVRLVIQRVGKEPRGPARLALALAPLDEESRLACATVTHEQADRGARRCGAPVRQAGELVASSVVEERDDPVTRVE